MAMSEEADELVGSVDLHPRMVAFVLESIDIVHMGIQLVTFCVSTLAAVGARTFHIGNRDLLAFPV